MRIQKYTYYLKSVFELLTAFERPFLILGIFTGVVHPPTPFEVRLRKSGLRFRVRGKMDIWSIKETLVDRFYERFGTPVGAGWTVTDVGAGVGDFAVLAAHRHPSNRVYAFEPYSPSFDLLSGNLALNSLSNVQASRLAVSGSSGSLHLDRTAGEPLQIKSRADTPAGDDGVGEWVVPAASLDEVFAAEHIERCDLLKLDCEGAEYDILFHADGHILARIDRIVMEYHEGVAEYNHDDMRRWLVGKGFDVQITPNFVHADLGYLYAKRTWPPASQSS